MTYSNKHAIIQLVDPLSASSSLKLRQQSNRERGIHMSLSCCYDYMDFAAGGPSDPVTITGWEKFLCTIKESKVAILRIHCTNGKCFIKLRSFEWGGSVLLSNEDAKKLVNKHGVPLYEQVYNIETDTLISNTLVRSF